MSYFRNGKSNEKAAPIAAVPSSSAQAREPGGVQIDGFQQVLEMLKIADPEFRESLLRRLALKDKELARNLRADLEG